MTSESGETYARLMTEPFVEALGTIDGSFALGGEPINGMALVQTRVTQALGKVDWESSGLGNHHFTSVAEELGEKPLSPRDYANRLNAYAFGDFYDLVHLCNEWVVKHPDVELDFGEVFKKSRNNLLPISALADPVKGRVISAAKTPEYAELFLGTKIEDNPIQLITDPDGTRRFAFSDLLQQYMDENRDPEAGCPARQIIITTPEGKKTTLINYFWDKLTLAMYG